MVANACYEISSVEVWRVVPSPSLPLSVCGLDKQEFHCILIFAVRTVRNAQCNQIIINPIQSCAR